MFCAGYGIAGDVRLTADESKAEVFLWQDYLDHEFMLMSMRTHRYIGKVPPRAVLIVWTILVPTRPDAMEPSSAGKSNKIRKAVG